MEEKEKEVGVENRHPPDSGYRKLEIIALELAAISKILESGLTLFGLREKAVLEGAKSTLSENDLTINYLKWCEKNNAVVYFSEKGCMVVSPDLAIMESGNSFKEVMTSIIINFNRKDPDALDLSRFEMKKVGKVKQPQEDLTPIKQDLEKWQVAHDDRMRESDIAEQKQDEWAKDQGKFKEELEQEKWAKASKKVAVEKWLGADVVSEGIESIAYHPNDKILRILFKESQTTYDYVDVPTRTHMDLLNSDSVGREYNNSVKGKYDAVQVQAADFWKLQRSNNENYQKVDENGDVNWS